MMSSTDSAPVADLISAQADTRQALLAAAVKLFNDVGYYGTDTNRIARAAGYAPATFYKHFKNKLEIFLECYPAVGPSFQELRSDLESGPTLVEGARRVVHRVLDHRRTWMGCNRSLRALALADPVAAQAYSARKKAATEAVRRLFVHVGADISEADAFVAQHLVSNVADAVVEGLTGELEVEVSEVVEVLVGLIANIAKMDIEAIERGEPAGERA